MRLKIKKKTKSDNVLIKMPNPAEIVPVAFLRLFHSILT